MSVEYKGQKPIFESEFLENVISEENYKSYFLGNYNYENSIVDLFMIIYKKSGLCNCIMKFGEEDSEYSSGSVFMFRDVIKKKDSPYSEIYYRALAEKIIIEKDVYIGYSEAKADEEYLMFNNSSYFKNKPKQIEIEMLLSMDEKDYDQAYLEHEKAVEIYDEEYLKNHDTIPKSNLLTGYHIFKDEAEAISYCSNGKGYFEKYLCINEDHISNVPYCQDFLAKFIEISQKNKS